MFKRCRFCTHFASRGDLCYLAVLFKNLWSRVENVFCGWYNNNNNNNNNNNTKDRLVNWWMVVDAAPVFGGKYWILAREMLQVLQRMSKVYVSFLHVHPILFEKLLNNKTLIDKGNKGRKMNWAPPLKLTNQVNYTSHLTSLKH